MILVGDASRYQGGGYNFAGLARAGVRGMYLQAQEGNDSANPYFDEQVRAVVDAGMCAGAYHFCEPLPDLAGHPNRDPQGQAQLFFDATAAARARGDLTMPPMADVEWPPKKDWPTWSVSSTSIARWVSSFVAHVDAMWLRRCGIYVDPAFASLLPPIEVAGWRERPLWAAAYPIVGALSAPPSAPPPVIPPWAKATIWQFTDKFSALGCAPCDGGVFLGDEDAWAEFLRS